MNAVTGRGGSDVEPVGDLCGMIEVFVQGVDVLENAATPTDNQVVDCDDVLGIFRERDAADMLRTPPQ